MSKRAPNVSVLTANRLADGLAVFLTADGTWVESVAGAAIARTLEEAEALKAAGVRDSARNLVVEPYLAEVAETGAGLLPQRMRERVRVEGPSILADVPGYVAPHGALHAVRPLSQADEINRQRRGKGSDPAPAAPAHTAPAPSVEAA